MIGVEIGLIGWVAHRRRKQMPGGQKSSATMGIQ
jgi:hypothetical protein